MPGPRRRKLALPMPILGRRPHRGSRPRPCRRTDGLLVERVAGETLVYDVERHRAHCLNRPAALIWSACDGTRDSAAIADEVAGSWPDVSVEMVEIAVSRLARARLLAVEPG